MVAGTAGLDDARYLARAPDRVLVVRTRDASAPPRRRLRRRKPDEVRPSPEDPTPPLTTLTAVWAAPLGSADEAGAWLDGLRADPEAGLDRIAVATTLINRAVHAQRAASLDPHLPEVSAEHALAVRIGYGAGDRVTEGRWERAIEIPRGERRRRGAVQGQQESIAAVLSGERRVPASVALLLRARADLDAARTPEAALQLQPGVEALLAELGDGAKAAPGPEESQAGDLRALEAHREAIAAAAIEARRGTLSAQRSEAVSEALAIAERVLRRRLAGDEWRRDG